MKNKVAAPFRKISFEIHFGKGLTESETLFDALRQYCDDHKIVKDGKEMKISGTSGWKELIVSDAKTGEVIVEKKFYKSEFAGMMRDPLYRPHILDITEAALTRTVEQQKADQYAAGEVDEDGYVIPAETPQTAKKEA
jgi:hypothetical protein